jgi:hypothetical protein
MEGSIVTLSEVIPDLSLQATESGGRVNGWETIDPNDRFNFDGWYDLSQQSSISRGLAWAFTTKLDVSGWGKQDLSFFPIQAGVQEGTFYDYLIDDTLEVLDMISDSPLDINEFVLRNFMARVNSTVPGMYNNLPSDDEASLPPLGWENVLYGQLRALQHNNNLQGLMVLPVNVNDFGSMNPTATDTLYFTRIVCPRIGNTTQAGGLCQVPITRMIIKGQLKAEDGLSYIYRLKDSFKTQQTDVGRPSA